MLRDNPFAADGTRSVGGTRGLVRVEAPEGTFVMYSAGAGQTALDGLSDSDVDANSVFTRSLVQLIKTPGLRLQEVALKVREQMVELATRS
jgi:caspase domain-containing protein